MKTAFLISIILNLIFLTIFFFSVMVAKRIREEREAHDNDKYIDIDVNSDEIDLPSTEDMSKLSSDAVKRIMMKFRDAANEEIEEQKKMFK